MFNTVNISMNIEASWCRKQFSQPPTRLQLGQRLIGTWKVMLILGIPCIIIINELLTILVLLVVGKGMDRTRAQTLTGRALFPGSSTGWHGTLLAEPAAYVTCTVISACIAHSKTPARNISGCVLDVHTFVAHIRCTFALCMLSTHSLNQPNAR